MRYELLLQPSEPGAPFERGQVEALLTARGAVASGEGLAWRLRSGEVEVRPLVEGGKAVALELRVALGAKEELVRELVAEASGLAPEAGLRLFDPQLMRALCAADAESVAAQFLRTARYAGEFLGLPEALGASWAEPDPGGLKAGTKVLLAVAALIALVLLASELLVR